MATNRPDTLDPALMRPGRLDRKIEFTVPDMEGRTSIFKIHARSMSCERDIRWELLARLCPNATGAEIRSVCTEAGMFAIRSRRKVTLQKCLIYIFDSLFLFRFAKLKSSKFILFVISSFRSLLKKTSSTPSRRLSSLMPSSVRQVAT